ncbi:MAG: aminotransferase class I/II-fold pyridoxal phosphate-dependent enzyme, partial [Thermovirgaceae bacterium]
GAVALYKTPKSYLEEVNKEYQARRDILISKVREMPGVICEEPKGAFYVVAKLPVDDAEKFVIWMLKDFHVDNETVMMAPAEGFYATPGLGRDEARLAYVLKKEDLSRAMDILKAGLEAYPGRIKSASNF